MDPLAALNNAIATLNAACNAAETAVSREQFAAEQAEIDESFKGPHGVLLGTPEQREAVHRAHREAHGMVLRKHWRPPGATNVTPEGVRMTPDLGRLRKRAGRARTRSRDDRDGLVSLDDRW